MCMARLNIRIRTRLFDSLLGQELGYFDTTKTGALGAHQDAHAFVTNERWRTGSEPSLC